MSGKPKGQTVNKPKISLMGERVLRPATVALSPEEMEAVRKLVKEASKKRESRQIGNEFHRSAGRTMSSVPSRVNKKPMSFWLPEDVVDSIKHLATIRGATIQDVLEEGLRNLISIHAADLQKYESTLREIKRN